MADITACLRCGNRKLRMPALGAGDAFLPYTEEIMGTVVCETCGYKAVPLYFDGEGAWRAFRGEREREGWKEWAVVGEGQSAVPTSDAEPLGLFWPGLLLAGGLTLVIVGSFGVLALVAGNPLAFQALGPFLVGVALTVIGVHLLRKAWGRRGTRTEP